MQIHVMGRLLAKTTLLLVAVFATTLTAVQAKPLPAMSRPALAQHYMQLLMAGKYAQLGSYLNESSTYTDSTAGNSYKGRRQIIAFLHRSNQGMIATSFEQSQFYVSNKVAVFVGTFHYRGEGSLYGFPEKTIEFSLPMVTVLSIDVKDQIVMSHYDLFDYEKLKPRVID